MPPFLPLRHREYFNCQLHLQRRLHWNQRQLLHLSGGHLQTASRSGGVHCMQHWLKLHARRAAVFLPPRVPERKQQRHSLRPGPLLYYTQLPAQRDIYRVNWTFVSAPLPQQRGSKLDHHAIHSACRLAPHFPHLRDRASARLCRRLLVHRP